MAYDLAGARAAGGTDEQIAKYLASKHGYDLDGALNAGGDYPQILDYLSTKEAPTQAAPEEAPRNLLGAAADVGRLIYDIPTQTMAAVGNLAEEDDPGATHDWRDRWREAGEQRTQERVQALGESAKEKALLGVTRGDIAEASGSTGFSAMAMGAGLIGGAAGSPAGPVGTGAGFLGASGAAAYKMDKTMFTSQLIDAANAALMEERGSGMTAEERTALLEKTADARNKHALWEAGPEAVGNLLTATGVGSIFRGVSKKVVGKIVGGLAKIYGGELATETVTQMGQQQAEVAAGLSKEAPREWTSLDDLGQSFKEIYPTTMVISTLTGGGGAVAGKVAGALSGPADITEPPPATPADILAAPTVDDAIQKFVDSTTGGQGATAGIINSVEADGSPPTEPPSGGGVGPGTGNPWNQDNPFERGFSNRTTPAEQPTPQTAAVESGLPKEMVDAIWNDGFENYSEIFSPATKGVIEQAYAEVGVTRPVTDEDVSQYNSLWQAAAKAGKETNDKLEGTNQPETTNGTTPAPEVAGMGQAAPAGESNIPRGSPATGILRPDAGLIAGKPGGTELPGSTEVPVAAAGQDQLVPGTGKATASPDAIKPAIEQLIKRKNIAKQIGLGNQLGAAVVNAKSVLKSGTGKAAYFTKTAELFKGKDDQIYEALTGIARALEPVKPAPMKPTPKRRVAAHNLIPRLRQLGGVNLSHLADITGESNVRKAGVVGVFSKAGRGLDDLATILRDEGFQIDTDTSDGGVQQLRDMIYDAVQGNAVLTFDAQEAKMAEEQEAEHRENINEQAKALGIKTVGRKFTAVESEVLNRLASQETKDETTLSDDEYEALDNLMVSLQGMIGEDATSAIYTEVNAEYIDRSARDFNNELTRRFLEAIDEHENRSVQKTSRTAEGKPGQGEAPGGQAAGTGENAAVPRESLVKITDIPKDLTIEIRTETGIVKANAFKSMLAANQEVERLRALKACL